MNKYDLNHICTTHPKMSREDWDRAYKMAWQRYYTIDHVETIMRRVAATKAQCQQRAVPHHLVHGLDQYRAHPSARKRLAAAEMSGATGGRVSPIEPIWSFYPKYFAEMASKVVRWGALYLRLRRIYLRIKHDPERFTYTDMAMTPVAADEAETHELFGTDAARAYVAQAKRVKDAQDGHAHEVATMEAAE